VSFQHHEFDVLSVLYAEAIGQPGSRRFRLVGGSGSNLVLLWMEKEQLNALGLAIEQLLTQISDAGMMGKNIKGELAEASGEVPPATPEYLVSKMAIGFDEERKLIAFFAHDIEQEDDDSPIFAGRATTAMAQGLAERIAEVIAAGRPRCPRCGAPIGPEGHVCPHDNGHLPWTGV
jgi:uncharacterized repeat protein (TIGR03847 family)